MSFFVFVVNRDSIDQVVKGKKRFEIGQNYEADGVENRKKKVMLMDDVLMCFFCYYKMWRPWVPGLPTSAI